MSTILEIIEFLLETLGGLFLTCVALRFFLQLARADFYNPISQSIVKITNPVLIPMRRVIPGVFGIDVASIVLALAIQVVFGEIIYLLYTGGFINPVQLLIWGLLGTLNLVTVILIICILIMVVSSFVAPYSTHPILTLVRQLMEPLIRPVQRVIPPAGGLDFSVMFVGIGIYVVRIALEGIAGSVGLGPRLVIGY